MLANTVLIGFDSAWANKPKAPGAICALQFDEAGIAIFERPELVNFAEAAVFIEKRCGEDRRILVAIDQPTIVINDGGSRPCEKTVASVISWSGGGIQPANLEGVGKAALFGPKAPLRNLLSKLNLIDDPKKARAAKSGSFIMEVYPALALLSFNEGFAARGKRPRYNPTRKSFCKSDWLAVCSAVSTQAEQAKLSDVAKYVSDLSLTAEPKKPDQDQLDAVICMLISVLWLTSPECCAIIGDLSNGYIVAPATGEIRTRLVAAAAAKPDRGPVSFG